MPQFAQINGVALHYDYRPGTAAMPVVLANSLGTDFRIWDDVVAALPAGTPVLRMDKRGHGLSALGPVTIAGLAADFAGLMDHLGLNAALICGVSVGGLIAQSLATSRPDLCAELVLCCTGMKIGDGSTWNPRIDAVRQDGIAPIADAILERWFSPDYRETRQTDLAGYRAMLTRTDAEGYARVCEAIRDADLTAAAATIRQPTTCIAGSADLATPPALVQALASALPMGRFQLIEGVGHLPCIEAPAEVATAILRHLGQA
jgi:3-oxoadipate enol-lactonase